MADDIEPLMIRRFRRNLEAIFRSPKGNLCVDCGHVKHNELGYCQIGQCSCDTGTTYSSVATILLRDLPDLLAVRHDADIAAAKAAAWDEGYQAGWDNQNGSGRDDRANPYRAALTTGGEGR